MYNELFNEKFKCKLDELKEKTLFALVKKDKNYQQLSTEYDQAEEKYRTLNLSIEQKTFIEYYLSLNDSCHMEYVTLNYLAGLIDGQKLGTLIPTAESNTLSNEKAILKFYYAVHQPCAERYESKETLEFWKKFCEKENAFAATLSSEQAAKLKEISNECLEGGGYSMADSFVQGFQACSELRKLLLD